MKRLILVVLFTMSAATFARGQATDVSPSRVEDDEQELLQIERSRSDAIKGKDMAVLDRIYADDFSGVAGNGRVVNKAQLLGVFKNTDPKFIFAVEELAARVFGESAVVTGRLTGKTPEGEVFNTSRFMHVYVKRQGVWKFVAGQSTNIAKQ